MEEKMGKYKDLIIPAAAAGLSGFIAYEGSKKVPWAVGAVAATGTGLYTLKKMSGED